MKSATGEVIRVLLIEDNPGDADLIVEMLESSEATKFEFHSVETLYDGSRRLAAKDIDVILLDLGLPDSQGLTTLRRMRTLAPVVPIVVMTGWGDAEISPWAMEAGAQGYLIKGEMNERVLTRAILDAIQRYGKREGRSSEP